MHSAKFVVGVARLELAALRSRTVRATKLRYTPLYIISFYLPSFIRCAIFMLVARAFRQVLRFRSKAAIDIGWTSNIFVCGQVLSQTKLRYTPSVNLIAYAIYINLQIFATKLRQLSKKLYLDCVFLAEVDKIVCKMRIV